MKIDNLLKEFTETYDRDSLESIDNISNDFSLKVSNSKINLVNLNESFDKFKKYLRGYSEYKINKSNEAKQVTRDEIYESMNNFVDTLFKTEEAIPYNEVSNYIKSYIENVNDLIKETETIKTHMEDSNVDLSEVGDVNDFVDVFVDHLQEAFSPSMDKILWASGYNAKQRLSKDYKKPKQNIVFL